jgi:CRISPR-associated protein Cmr3
MLYTSEVVALRPGVSFLTAVVGTGDRAIPAGVLRLGGDGRGAAIRDFATASDSSWPSSGQPAGKRFAISLASPCPSPRGWLLPGMRREDDGSVLFESSGIRARLRGVALPRFDVISGWDLARRAPKPAQRMAPTGAVYWLESLGDSSLAAEELEKEGILNEDAISGLPEAEQGALRQRAAEGFGSVWIGCWPGEEL